MSGLWFEELTVGLVVEHATRRTVTETDNVLFTTMTMNPAPLHLDQSTPRPPSSGKPLVNCMFTLALVVGLSVPELTLGTTVAKLGLSDIEFPKPVFHGRHGPRGRPRWSRRARRVPAGRGHRRVRAPGRNQRDELVCRATRAAFMRRRPAS